MDASAKPATPLEVFLAYRSVLRASRRDLCAREGAALGGQMVLLEASAECGQQRAAAARIAGAAVLLVVAEPAAAKALVRAGACDFLVTSLDEALRILKNEVRSRAAVGVCLLGSPGTVVQECVERGVQPDLLGRAEDMLMRRGSRVIAWDARLQPGERVIAFRVGEGPLAPLEGAIDSILRVLEPGSGERVQWMRQAPRVLGRAWQRMRLLPMDEAELARLLDALDRVPVPGLSVESDAVCVWPR